MHPSMITIIVSIEQFLFLFAQMVLAGSQIVQGTNKYLH